MEENSLDSQDTSQNTVNAAPDLNPVELPGRNMDPSVEDRLAAIETILNINY